MDGDFVRTFSISNQIMADNASEHGDLGTVSGGGGGALFLQASDGPVVHATLARNGIGHGDPGVGHSGQPPLDDQDIP